MQSTQQYELFWVFSTDFCNLEITKILQLTSKQTNKTHQNQTTPSQKKNKQKTQVPDSNRPKPVSILFLKTKMLSHWRPSSSLNCEICVRLGQWRNPISFLPILCINIVFFTYDPRYAKKWRSKSTSAYMHHIWSPGEGRSRAECFPSETSWLWFSSIISQLISKRTHIVRLFLHVINKCC